MKHEGIKIYSINFVQGQNSFLFQGAGKCLEDVVALGKKEIEKKGLNPGAFNILNFAYAELDSYLMVIENKNLTEKSELIKQAIETEKIDGKFTKNELKLIKEKIKEKQLLK